MLDTTICCGGYGCNDLQDLWREPSQIFAKSFILKAPSETSRSIVIRLLRPPPVKTGFIRVYFPGL